MKNKKIFTIAFTALLLVGCGGSGASITTEEALAQATAMKEKVSSNEFEAPKKLHYKEETTITSSEGREKLTLEVYQDFENYGYSISMIEEETGNGQTQTESNYMAAWIEGTTVYMAMAEGSNKQYAKQDCGEQATAVFNIAIQDVPYVFDKTFFLAQLDAIESALDLDAMKKEFAEQFGSNVEVTASSEAKSKNEGHIYVAAECSISTQISQSGINMDVTATAKTNAEFENYLIVSAYSESNATTRVSLEGQVYTETALITDRLTVSYSTSFAKPNLNGYVERSM